MTISFVQEQQNDSKQKTNRILNLSFLIFLILYWPLLWEPNNRRSEMNLILVWNLFWFIKRFVIVTGGRSIYSRENILQNHGSNYTANIIHTMTTNILGWWKKKKKKTSFTFHRYPESSNIFDVNPYKYVQIFTIHCYAMTYATIPLGICIGFAWYENEIDFYSCPRNWVYTIGIQWVHSWFPPGY